LWLVLLLLLHSWWSIQGELFNAGLLNAPIEQN